MKPVLITVLGLLCNFLFSGLHAQPVFWAQKVDTCSSQYSLDRSGAREILGVPNVDFRGRSSIYAWCVKPNVVGDEGVETAYIEVSFDKAIKANQLAVFENFNPGAISHIQISSIETGTVFKTVYADTSVIARTGYFDPSGTIPDNLKDTIGKVERDWYLLTKDAMFQSKGGYNILSVFFDEQTVISVRIVLNVLAIDGWNQLDAVGITYGNTPIKYPEVKLADQSLVLSPKAEKFSDRINTGSNELAPVIGVDEKAMYFTRTNYKYNLNKYTQDIWYSEKKVEPVELCYTGKTPRMEMVEKWQPAKLFFDQFNSIIPNAVVGFSPKGDYVYLLNSYIEKDKNCNCDSVFIQRTDGLSVSHLDTTIWKPFDKKLLKPDSTYLINHSNFVISPDSSIVLSIKKDTVSKIPIFFAQYIERRDKWSAPVEICKLDTINNKFEVPARFKVPFYYMFVQKQITDSGTLYIVTDLKWRFPKPVKITNYQNTGRYAHYTIAANGTTMLMALETPAGFGGRDLYVSMMGEDSVWSEPLNLGSAINTLSDEASAFLDEDGETLYFSSSGHSGYGDRDIYVCRRLDDSWVKWSKPLNLGTSVNTAMSDSYFYIAPKSRNAFYSSAKNANGCNDKSDIYTVKMSKPITLTIKGRTLNVKTKQPVGKVNVSLNTLEDGEIDNYRKAEFVSDTRTGEYQIKITKMIDANKISEFGLKGIRRATVQTDKSGKNEINFEKIVLENPGWDIEINRDVYLRTDGEINLIDPDKIIENKPGQYDNLIDTSKSLRVDTVYIYVTKYDTVTMQVKEVTGNLIVESGNCETLFHKGNMYFMSAKVEGEPVEITFLLPAYQKYFSYNQTDISISETEFDSLMVRIYEKLSLVNEITIHVVASASRVPTNKFKSNQDLAEKRSAEAIKRIQNALEKSKIEKHRYQFSEETYVLGEKYKNDAFKKEQYGQYQYVKIWLEVCPYKK